jgi:hypothetical protein
MLTSSRAPRGRYDASNRRDPGCSIGVLRRSIVAVLAACTSSTPPAHAPASAPNATRPDDTARPIVRAPSATPSCGKLATPLDGEVALLAGRLTLRVPAGAGPRARAYGIMSSPVPPDQETRVMIGGGGSAGKAPGDEALVILAAETWQLDPDRVHAEADAPVRPGPLDTEAQPYLRAMVRNDALDVERARIADGALRVYAGRPREVKVSEGADAALVLTLLVGSPDATLQMVSFWVSPGLAGEPGCTNLAERIAATLSLGSRKLERGGVRVLHDVLPDQALAVTLPDDYVVVHQPGPDVDVHKLFRLRPLGLFPGSISIAIDLHPNQAIPPGTTEEPGMLLGRPVTWYTRRGPTGGKMLATQPLASGQSPEARFLQVAIVATREAKFLAEFRRVAESLSIVKR